MRNALRIFARVVLLSPVIVLVVGLLCTYIPGASEFISKVFWETLGEVNAFRYASQLIQQGLNYTTLSPDRFFSSLLRMISAEVMDAMVLGASVFLLKSIFLRFNRRFFARYTQPEWVITVAGVVLGIVLLGMRGMLTIRLQSSLTVIFCIGCLIYGIVHMLGYGKNLTRGGTYMSRLLGTIIGLLVDFLGNGVTAFCAVLLITCGMEGPRFIQAGGSLFVWLLWCLLSAGVLYLSEFILRAFRR